MPCVKHFLKKLCFFIRYRKKVEELQNQGSTTLSTELKQINEEHKNKYGTSREPLLTGIASSYDLDLFRRAQVGKT